MLLEKGFVGISSRFRKLVISPRTATEQDGMLDKQSTSLNDTFDAFMVSLRYYREQSDT